MNFLLLFKYFYYFDATTSVAPLHKKMPLPAVHGRGSSAGHGWGRPVTGHIPAFLPLSPPEHEATINADPAIRQYPLICN